MADIAIVGLGNLGSRHLQGLAKCPVPLRISLHDPFAGSLETARERWSEAGGEQSGHVLLSEGLTRYDLAIVATTADIRPAAVDALADVAAVNAWLLEKPLAQSRAAAQRIAARVGAASAWVNLPRRVIPWHQAIAREIAGFARPLAVTVSGGPWGLACNATHFVDLVRWWTSTDPVAVDASGLDAEWQPSKRPGYVDVFGALVVDFTDGSRLHLESSPDGGPHLIDVEAGRERLRIAEGQGQCARDGTNVVEGRMAFQSALTGDVVHAILRDGRPALPTLADVARFEGLLLDALIPHRAACGGPTDRLDIT